MTSPQVDDKWKQLPWKKFQKVVFRLQKRIFKAQKANDAKLAHKLQKLLLTSKAAKYLAIRQVTQLNQGKKTAGIDGKKALNTNERMKLLPKMEMKTWKHSKLKRVWIPKSNGTKRPLGIPTILDRAMQDLIKLALEPMAEAYFNAHSYGFRPGRSCHDVQKLLFSNLSSQAKGKQKRILEMDIEKCFDQIDHSFLMKQIQLPKLTKQKLFGAIKAGVVGERPFSFEGTPQGGIISPLLANIALHGLENVGYKLRYKLINGGKQEDTIRGIRYADDCVFILKPGDDEIKLRELIDEFLTERGLKVSEAKTKVINSTEGFDFLGWNFKVKEDGRFISTPSDKNHKKIKEEVRKSLKNSIITLEQRIQRATSQVRGWRNYHQYCDMTKFNLWHLNHWSWKFIRKQGRYNRTQTNEVIKQMFPSISWKATGFVKVQGERSPFDGDMFYWSKRSSNKYDGYTARNLKKQDFKCNYCKLAFLPDDRIELHHIDGDHANWKPLNLEALHKSCHQYKPIHSIKRSLDRIDKGVQTVIDAFLESKDTESMKW